MKVLREYTDEELHELSNHFAYNDSSIRGKKFLQDISKERARRKRKAGENLAALTGRVSDSYSAIGTAQKTLQNRDDLSLSQKMLWIFYGGWWGIQTLRFWIQAELFYSFDEMSSGAHDVLGSAALQVPGFADLARKHGEYALKRARNVREILLANRLRMRVAAKLENKGELMYTFYVALYIFKTNREELTRQHTLDVPRFMKSLEEGATMLGDTEEALYWKGEAKRFAIEHGIEDQLIKI